MSQPSPSLRVNLGPLPLEHPLINASGTLDLLSAADALGDGIRSAPPVAAYVPKTVTLEPRHGNPPPRIAECAAGMLNSIGLPNEGIAAFVTDTLPRLLELTCPLVINVAGFSLEEYVQVAERLVTALRALLGQAERTWAARVGLEINISCPNVHSGCMSIGTDAGETAAVTEAVRRVWPEPLLLAVKLTPNVTDIAAVALAAQDAGASAVSLVNTFKGMVLDRETLRPYLGGVTGGLSGPAIKPLALRCVFEVAAAVQIPVIGMGGVATVEDVLDFMACGAGVVAVGAAGFVDPWLPGRLALELGEELRRRRLTLAELVGIAHRQQVRL